VIMMSSNYPPGVTGNEYEIAGPDMESEDNRRCEECDKNTDHYIEGYRGIVTIQCQACSDESDISDEYDGDPDKSMEDKKELDLWVQERGY